MEGSDSVGRENLPENTQFPVTCFYVWEKILFICIKKKMPETKPNKQSQHKSSSVFPSGFGSLQKKNLKMTYFHHLKRYIC